MLLEAGTRGSVVDQALISATQEGKGPGSIELMKLLLTRASVDYNHGKALGVAISRCDLEQLGHLLEAHPKPSTLVYIWNSAASLHDLAYQAAVFKRLLDNNTAAALLERELVVAITRGYNALHICELLLGHDLTTEVCTRLPVTCMLRQ